MPFFQGATNVQANQGVFYDVAGDQHITHLGGSREKANPNAADSTINISVNNSPAVTKSPTPISEPEHLPSPQKSPDIPVSTTSAPVPESLTLPTPASPASKSDITENVERQSPLISTNSEVKKLEEPKNQSSLISANSNAKKSEEPNNESGLADNVLAISAFVLNQLSFVAANSPIPGLSTAAYLALTIVTNVQGARGNKGDFARLAKDSCDLVYVVCNICDARKNDGKQLPKDLISDLESLVMTLKQVEEFSQKLSNRRGFAGNMKRFLSSNADMGKIKEFREGLGQALNIFWLRSNIHVRKQLADVAEEQGAMHKEMRNGVHATPVAGNTSKSTSGGFASPHEVLSTFASVDFSKVVWNDIGSAGSTNISYNFG